MDWRIYLGFPPLFLWMWISKGEYVVSGPSHRPQLCLCFFLVTVALVSLVQTRTYAPLSGRCGAAVVKNGLGHFCFIVLYFASLAIWTK